MMGQNDTVAVVAVSQAERDAVACAVEIIETGNAHTIDPTVVARLRHLHERCHQASTSQRAESRRTMFLKELKALFSRYGVRIQHEENYDGHDEKCGDAYSFLIEDERDEAIELQSLENELWDLHSPLRDIRENPPLE